MISKYSIKTIYALLVLFSVKISISILIFLYAKNFINIVDYQLYLDGFYINDKTLRLQIIQIPVYFLKNIFGNIITNSIFSCISLLGMSYYIISGGRKLFIILFLLLPSTLIWTSIVGKECVFYGFYTLIIVIISKYAIYKLSIYDLVAAAISFAICMLLRPHYAIVLLWFFISIYFIKNFTSRLKYLFLTILFVSLASVLFYEIYDELMFRAYSGIDHLARSSRFEYFAILPNPLASPASTFADSGFLRFKSFVPLGALLGILGPLPFEIASRPMIIIFLLEGLFILIFPFIFLFKSNELPPEDKKLFLSIFWIALFPGLLYLIIAHAPFGLLNFGSATRWRVNFEPAFYLFPLLLYLNIKSKHSNSKSHN